MDQTNLLTILNIISRHLHGKLLIILMIFVISFTTLIAINFLIIAANFSSVSGLSYKKINENEIDASQNSGQFINNTILIDPSDRTLADVIANKVNLYDYLTPKDSDFIITNGNWTMEQLSEKFPNVVQRILTDGTLNNNSFLIKKTIVVNKNAELDIIKDNILLESFLKKDNIPVAIITNGKTKIIDSTISSWDTKKNTSDTIPYHPRSFIVATNGGKMDIINSTLSNLGFSQGGIHSLFSSLAAINYYNTSNFILSNNTIFNNLYGLLTDNASNFKIIGNDIFSHIGYGIDLLSGSKDIVIDSNHIYISGLQGIICSHQCENITITNNIINYNVEGIGLYWQTNSSTIKDNIVNYNKNTGIFIKNSSNDNTIENNKIIGNGYGIQLLNGSLNNNIRDNVLIGNILDKDGITIDKDSKSNAVKNNRIFPVCNKTLLKDNVCKQIFKEG